jgi:hypothetical protein
MHSIMWEAILIEKVWENGQEVETVWHEKRVKEQYGRLQAVAGPAARYLNMGKSFAFMHSCQFFDQSIQEKPLEYDFHAKSRGW